MAFKLLNAFQDTCLVSPGSFFDKKMLIFKKAKSDLNLLVFLVRIKNASPCCYFSFKSSKLTSLVS